MEQTSLKSPVQLELFQKYEADQEISNHALVNSIGFETGFETTPWMMHEFFAGSGLVACALKGLFTPNWANDISLKKANVYYSNFGNDYFVLDDICNIKGGSLPFAHLSWASFPCQDLSLAGNIEGIHASRSGMIWEWLRVLDEIKEKPKVLILENVVGLVSSKNGENYRILHEALIKRGYRSGAILINADRFLPQSRPRVFIIAVAKRCDIPKELISEKPSWVHNEAIRKLGITLNDWLWWKLPTPPVRNIELKNVIDNTIPFNKDDVLKYISSRHLNILNSFDNIYATGYRRTRNGKQQLELRFDGVAGCLRTPEGGSSKQFLIVKKGNEVHARLLSVREVARLMGAPESFNLPGSYNDGYMAMGDAVAVPVVRFIGAYLLNKLVSHIYNEGC